MRALRPRAAGWSPQRVFRAPSLLLALAVLLLLSSREWVPCDCALMAAGDVESRGGGSSDGSAEGGPLPAAAAARDILQAIRAHHSEASRNGDGLHHVNITALAVLSNRSAAQHHHRDHHLAMHGGGVEGGGGEGGEGHPQLHHHSPTAAHILLDSVSALRAAMLAVLRRFPRNEAVLAGVRGCASNATGAPPAFHRVYVTQDYTGGGGIGNLLLKINAGVTFALSNGLPYLLPPLLPFGHHEEQEYKHFFPHAVHDAVLLTADGVLQLECIHKYGSTQRLRRFFPDVRAEWTELGGREVIPEEEWKGVPGRRCAPRQTLANCDRVQWRAAGTNARPEVAGAGAHGSTKTMPTATAEGQPRQLQPLRSGAAAMNNDARSITGSGGGGPQGAGASGAAAGGGGGGGEDDDGGSSGQAGGVFVLRLPGHLKYHANFSLSASVFRAAYSATQAASFNDRWGGSMLAAHARTRARCEADGLRFAVVGVHIRLGDMAEGHTRQEREALASATPNGLRWGTKYNSPRMHIGALEIVWGVVPPPCTRLLVVTDGFATDPEMEFFFSHLQQHAHAHQLLLQQPQAPRPRDDNGGGGGDDRRGGMGGGRDGGGIRGSAPKIAPRCIHDPLAPEALSGCPLLFFNRTLMSSVESLNLLAAADVVVASGSQFSRVASMLGGNVLLNPNYGYIPADHVRIPTDLSSTYDEMVALRSKLRLTQERRRDRVAAHSHHHYHNHHQ